MRKISGKVSGWLLLGWCGFVAAWLLVDHARQSICLFGYDRCSDRTLIQPTGMVTVAVVGIAGAVLLTGLWVVEHHRAAARPEAVAQAGAARRVRPVVLAGTGFVVVLAAAHLLLLAPMDKTLPCGTPVRIDAHLGYPMNCDSPLFMQLAHKPQLLLQKDSVRQSRPVYVYLAAAATAVIGPVAHWVGLDALYGQSDSAFIPMVLINLVVAAAAVALFLWLMLLIGAPPAVTWSLTAILAVNDMTKAYYWPPHQQMFGLLVPMATAVVCRWLFLNRPSWRFAATAGLILGISALAYASVLITVAAGALTILITAERRVPALRLAVAKAAVLLAASAAPTLVWIEICRAVTGTYYNHEAVTYHEFVWLPQAAAAGWRPLVHALSNATMMTGGQLIEVTWLLVAVLAVLAVGAVFLRVDIVAGEPGQRAALAATGVSVLCTLAFLWGLGFWAYRLTYHVVPLLLILIGWIASRLSNVSVWSRYATQVGLVVIAAGWVAFELFSHGPYS
ncbi:MAG TPA: hypothetical protein VGJ07_06915 [Rugosimonospora sp.]